MAKKKLTELEYIAEPLNESDEFHIVDISDDSQHASGSSRRATLSQLITYINGEVTINASQISDFDTEVSNNDDVLANTAERHSHANKSLLDTYTESNADIVDAILKKHTQNTDTILDDGGANEISASELRSHVDDNSNPHSVTKSQVGLGNVLNVAQIPASEKGVANGVASLDSNAKIPTSQLPPLATTETFVVADETAMLALDAQTGDLAVRTDTSETFILSGSDPSVLGDWTKLATPTDSVQSVNGYTGTILLDTDDIDEGSTNKYFTDARALSAIVKEFAFDPTADDDDSDTGGNGSFEVGELWLNELDGGLFQIEDNSTGASVWREIVKLNEAGELVGVFIPRHDTQSVIDGIVLEDGEIAFTTDRNEVRLGNGVDAGGIQAECHYTEGEQTALAGTGVTNAQVSIDLGGSTIPDLAGYDIEWTARITAYKENNGIKYFYDQVETNTATATGGNDYDVDITWDPVVGADGYMVEIHTYIPDFSLDYHEYADAYRDVGDVQIYEPVNTRPSQSGSDALNWIWQDAPLDASGQTYYEIALQAIGGINIDAGGAYQKNGVTFVDVTPTNAVKLGINNINQLGESLVVGNSNEDVGTVGQIGGGVIGFNNVNVGLGYVFGQDNDGSGIIVGSSNTNLAGGITIGSGNSNNFGDVIIGNNLASVYNSILFGEGGSFTVPPTVFSIGLDSAKIGTFVDSPSYDIELNKETMIETPSSEAILIKNGGLSGSKGGWVYGSSWQQRSFKGINKYQDGTDTLSPPNNPIVAGERYLVVLNFLETAPEGAYAGNEFEGSVNVNVGGVDIGDISKVGNWWFTVTAETSDNLVITPNTASTRMMLFNAGIYPIGKGNLHSQENIHFGNNSYHLRGSGKAELGQVEIDAEDYGPNLIGNPKIEGYYGTSTYGTAQGWTVGSGWRYRYDRTSFEHYTTGTGTVSQDLKHMLGTMELGETYELKYTVANRTAGDVTPSVGGVTLTTRSANGTYTETFVCTDVEAILTFLGSSTARIDVKDIYLRKVNNASLVLKKNGNINHELLDDGSSHFNKNQETDGDTIISTENVVEAFKVDSSADEVIVNTEFKLNNFLNQTFPHEDGVREMLYKAKLDEGNGLFFINNGTITNGVFAPVFGGYTDSTTLWPLGFGGYVPSSADASDSSSFGLIDFALFRTTDANSPLNGTLSSIQNRKLITIRNNGDVYFEMSADGIIDLGNNLNVDGVVTQKINSSSNGSNLAINTDEENLRTVTLTGNIQITLNNGVSGQVQTFKLILKQDATGGRTVTWANVDLPGGVSPVLSSGANDVDILEFLWDGSSWYLTNFISDLQ